MRATKLIAVTALLAYSLVLSGCAELNRRGGVADQLEDVVFRAETKSHRLLRSYVLVGVLLAVSDQASAAGKKSIKGQLEGALSIVKESYECLFPGAYDEATTNAVVKSYGGEAPTLNAKFRAPHWCQFFDEKMRRLDHSLFHLATVTLYPEESRSGLNQVTDRMIGRLPVISETLKSLISANRAAKEATTFIDDLLTLSVTSFGPAAKLLPLYRDVVELNSWIILDSLAVRCAMTTATVEPVKDATWPSTPLDKDLHHDQDLNACPQYKVAFDQMAKGNAAPDRLHTWIADQDLLKLRVDAYPTHFYVVTKFVANACVRSLGKEDCNSAFRAAAGDRITDTFPSDLKLTDRQVTAFLAPTTRLASGKANRPALARRKPAQPDPVSTGSIPGQR